MTKQAKRMTTTDVKVSGVKKEYHRRTFDVRGKKGETIQVIMESIKPDMNGNTYRTGFLHRLNKKQVGRGSSITHSSKVEAIKAWEALIADCRKNAKLEEKRVGARHLTDDYKSIDDVLKG